MNSDWWQKLLRALACETKRFDLASPRGRADCVHLLRETIDRQWMLLGSRPVMGRIDDVSFSLRKRIFYNNPLQTIVRGELFEESRETRLACVSAPYAFFVWFYLVGVVATLLFMTAVIWSLITDSSALDTGSLIGLGVPLLMISFCIALVRFCRFLARNEERYLVEFLVKTLDAHLV